MANPFLAEIVMFAGNFAPRAWAFCDGQLLPINQNQALFSLLGTIYGGDGRTTFALPELRGRFAVHPGNGPGLSNYNLGQKGGVEQVTLNTTQLPSHNHAVTPQGSEEDATGGDPAGNYPATTGANTYHTAADLAPMGAAVCGNTGGNQQHENRQPYCCVNFLIALQGIFPSRS